MVTVVAGGDSESLPPTLLSKVEETVDAHSGLENVDGAVSRLVDQALWEANLVFGPKAMYDALVNYANEIVEKFHVFFAAHSAYGAIVELKEDLENGVANDFGV